MLCDRERVRVKNLSRQQFLITRGQLASMFWPRLRGLMGRPTLDGGDGLVLAGDKSIHTFFMGFSIDVVYANREWQVIRVDTAMPPNRIGPFVREATYILELPVGVIQSTGTTIGDQLSCNADAIAD